MGIVEGSEPSADFNDDGSTDGGDFLAWQRGFGLAEGAQLGDGDANGDGAVNGADLTAWQSQFGQAATPTAMRVPEPCSLALFTVAVTLSAFRWHRRNKRSTTLGILLSLRFWPTPRGQVG